MPPSIICVPEGVVRITADGNQRTRFTGLATQQRLGKEDAYRKERLHVLSTRQNNRRHPQDVDKAARDAENQLQLFGLIFAQLARQENELHSQPATGNNSTSKERERMRIDATEILRTIL